MARVKNITRTLKITRVTALLLNVETAEPFNETFNLEGTFKNDESILKALKKEYETEECKIVHIVATEVITRTLSMPLQSFIDLTTIAEDMGNCNAPTCDVCTDK
jgi:uncharacterized protein YjgD (DUF1641 family)